MLMRPQGQLAFATLATRRADPAVRLRGVTDDFEAFARLSLGDWVGACREDRAHPQGRAVGAGTRVGAARRGARGFGDKWKGVTDIETRFRQREVDLWANERTRARS